MALFSWQGEIAMKWILLLIVLAGGAYAYKHFVLDKGGASGGGGSSSGAGIGAQFLDAAKVGDDARIRGLCEPEAVNNGVEVAHKVAGITYTTSIWRTTQPE